MKRSFALVALLCGTSAIAVADSQASVADVPENPLRTPWSRPQATYRFIDPGLVMDIGENNVEHAVNNVIYLNNCKPNGCQVSPGQENSAQNRSTIPNQPSTVQAFAYSDSVWNQVVQCVRDTYAPFNVTIVTERPTAPGYHMAIVAGRPQDVQMQQGVGGVSPFTCGFINGGISFSFANIYGGDVNDTCWTVAQETAHSWGLDHKYDNKDPMTYLQSGPSRKSFQNQAGPCGEYQSRACSCGGSTMNSYQAILSTFGPSGPPTPPTVTITAPANGATVDAGFPVRADIMDGQGVSKAELYVDNALVATITTAPWVFNAPASLAQGNHVVKVVGYDIGGAAGEATVTVAIGRPCSSDVPCSDATNVCVDGRCVAGSGVDGGLGTACTDNAQCRSGQCASDAEGNRYCVESCNPAAEGCPGDFGCIEAGTGGVCWPGAGDGGGCSSTDANGGVIFLGLGLGALLITRRRRR
ncbi:MAG: Ig-like domain-containing protein [Kofleriaceae bacterium]